MVLCKKIAGGLDTRNIGESEIASEQRSVVSGFQRS